jgi:hypothetical protein
MKSFEEYMVLIVLPTLSKEHGEFILREFEETLGKLQRYGPILVKHVLLFGPLLRAWKEWCRVPHSKRSWIDLLP